MAFESLQHTVNDRRPGKLATYIEGLDTKSKRNLMAALTNPDVSSSAIRRALLAEGLRVAISTVTVYRDEVALTSGKGAA